MRKNISAYSWICSFICVVIILTLIVGSVVYIIDPFFRFRVVDGKYFLNPKYVSPGLVRNYDYDTLILGSSMIQNFNMQSFRDKLNCKPLHIGIGGAKPAEILKYIELSEKVGKADTYYICIDISSFAFEPVVYTPEYLFDDGLISDFKYIYNYEAICQFVPANIALMALEKINPNTGLYDKKTQIDYLGDWSDDFRCSEKSVIENYNSGAYKPASVNPDTFYELCAKKTDDFFEILNKSKDYVFFIPPYSSLYWYDKINSGEFDVLNQGKKYFVEKALNFGATVYDFQAAELTVDLNNYRDTTHYSHQINEWIVDRFKDGAFKINRTNIDDTAEIIVANTKKLRDKYGALIK